MLSSKQPDELLHALSVMESFDESLLDSSSPSQTDVMAVSDALTRFCDSLSTLYPHVPKVAQKSLQAQIDAISDFLDNLPD